MARETTTYSETGGRCVGELGAAPFDADRMVDDFILLSEWLRDNAPAPANDPADRWRR